MVDSGARGDGWRVRIRLTSTKTLSPRLCNTRAFTVVVGASPNCVAVHAHRRGESRQLIVEHDVVNQATRLFADMPVSLASKFDHRQGQPHKAGLTR